MKAALHCPKDACTVTSSRSQWRTGSLKVEAFSIYAVLRVLSEAGSLKLEALIYVHMHLRCLSCACEMSCCTGLTPAHLQPRHGTTKQPPLVQHQRLTC